MIAAQPPIARVGTRPVTVTGVALLSQTAAADAGLGRRRLFDDIFFSMLMFGLEHRPTFATATITTLAGVPNGNQDRLEP